MSKAAKKQARAWVKGEISPSQIKAIHAAIHKLGLDDADYRAILLERFGAQSCKELTWRQAEELLESLNGAPPTHKSHKTQGLKYTDFDGRPGFATGAQCRLIAAMFHQVTKCDKDNEAMIGVALNSFVSRICRVAGLRMLKGFQVEQVVKALEAMGAVKK